MGASTTPRAGSRIEARLAKAASGIRGFDELTDGGLPRGRPTLVTGRRGRARRCSRRVSGQGGARLR